MLKPEKTEFCIFSKMENVEFIIVQAYVLVRLFAKKFVLSRKKCWPILCCHDVYCHHYVTQIWDFDTGNKLHDVPGDKLLGTSSVSL